MDLKEFTTQTLVQIVEGAIEANVQLSGMNSFIPSTNIRTTKGYSIAYDASGIERLMHYVDFDVAITASESDGKSGGAGIKVIPFNFGGNIESKIENQTISRVKYTIPIVMGGPKHKA